LKVERSGSTKFVRVLILSLNHFTSLFLPWFDRRTPSLIFICQKKTEVRISSRCNFGDNQRLHLTGIYFVDQMKEQTVDGVWIHLLYDAWIPKTRIIYEVFVEHMGLTISRGRWKLVSFMSPLSGRKPTTVISTQHCEIGVFYAGSFLALSHSIQPVHAKESYRYILTTYCENQRLSSFLTLMKIPFNQNSKKFELKN